MPQAARSTYSRPVFDQTVTIHSNHAQRLLDRGFLLVVRALYGIDVVLRILGDDEEMDQVEEIGSDRLRQVGIRTDLPPPHEEAPVDVGTRFGGHQAAEEISGRHLLSDLHDDLDKLLMEETGLPVVVADDPMTCVARGGGRVIELIDEHGPAVFGLE